MDKGLIVVKPNIAVDAVLTTVNQQWDITARGLQYLSLMAKLAAK